MDGRYYRHIFLINFKSTAGRLVLARNLKVLIISSLAFSFKYCFQSSISKYFCTYERGYFPLPV